MNQSCFMFDLEQLAQVGCSVTLDGSGLLEMVRIKLPDGRSVTCNTGAGSKVFLPYREAIRDIVDRLVAIGAEAVEIEDIPF